MLQCDKNQAAHSATVQDTNHEIIGRAKHLRQSYHYNVAYHSAADRACSIYHSHLSVVSQRASGLSVFLYTQGQSSQLLPEDLEVQRPMWQQWKCVVHPSMNWLLSNTAIRPNGPSAALRDISTNVHGGSEREKRALNSKPFVPCSSAHTLRWWQTHLQSKKGNWSCGVLCREMKAD